MLSAPRQHCDAAQIRATNTSPDPVCLSRREHRSKSFQILNGNLLYKKSSFRSHLTHKTAVFLMEFTVRFWHCMGN